MYSKKSCSLGCRWQASSKFARRYHRVLAIKWEISLMVLAAFKKLQIFITGVPISFNYMPKCFDCPIKLGSWSSQQRCAWQKNMGSAGPFNLSVWNSRVCECKIMNTNCACVYCKCKNVKKLCKYVPIAVALYLIVLAVMCIYVIYKCLSWAGDQQQDLGKPS